MPTLTTRVFNFFQQVTFRNRRLVVTLVHLLQAILANYLAFILRFEGVIPKEHFDNFITYLPLLVLVRLVFYVLEGLHKDLWRYASVNDLARIFKSVTFGSVIFFILVRTFFNNTLYPRSIYVIDWLLLIMLSGGMRFFIRVFREYLESGAEGRRVLIIGAGDAGEMIARDMKNNPNTDYVPVGFLDDDKYKSGLTIHGVPILGTVDEMEAAIKAHDPEEILICIPSAGQKAIRRIYDACKPFSLPINILPGVSEILDGSVTVSNIKPFSFEDLLQREPVRTDIKDIRDYVGGRRVMVTGAGGSIGSELSRQISGYGPQSLVLLDRYENSLFEIDLELRRDFPGLKLVTAIGDIADSVRIRSLLGTEAPEVIFHAAAHKHVPLMEANPLEAIKNNVFGTKNLIEAAIDAGVGDFVLISTDKAVNPTNTMGATKRIAEFMALSANKRGSTRFSTVRFGNVLGSNGSVLHVFQEQIKKGNPLTVTHPDITRFFMLIPEAAQLVLLAASHGKGGEIFVLDMGEPIRIVDFAENVIRLSGRVPYEDIDIVFTGLRPGEKLYEELFDKTERMEETELHGIHMAVPEAVPTDEELQGALKELRSVVEAYEDHRLEEVIRRIVPGYNKSV